MSRHQRTCAHGGDASTSHLLIRRASLGTMQVRYDALRDTRIHQHARGQILNVDARVVILRAPLIRHRLEPQEFRPIQNSSRRPPFSSNRGHARVETPGMTVYRDSDVRYLAAFSQHLEIAEALRSDETAAGWFGMWDQLASARNIAITHGRDVRNFDAVRSRAHATAFLDSAGMTMARKALDDATRYAPRFPKLSCPVRRAEREHRDRSRCWRSRGLDHHRARPRSRYIM